jgi:hypothetical protein
MHITTSTSHCANGDVRAGRDVLNASGPSPSAARLCRSGTACRYQLTTAETGDAAVAPASIPRGMADDLERRTMATTTNHEGAFGSKYTIKPHRVSTLFYVR